MRKTLLLLMVFFMIFAACKKPRIDEAVRKVIEEETEVFASQQVPGGLIEAMDRNEVLLFGETHYVQQHQEYIVSILPELSSRGYRVIFDELFHCFSWMVEDYISGARDALPEFILFFNETLIEGIKDFNQSVPDSLKISAGIYGCQPLGKQFWLLPGGD